VGAVCRIMGNFGATDLRLVNPCEEYRGADARRMATKARPLLEAARCFPLLEEALADRHWVIGATARQGKYRDACLTPRQMAKRVAALTENGRVALVLGREDRGLSRKEIECCDALVTVPTADGYPVLNLSQAAGVLLYELFLAQNENRSRPEADAPHLADHHQLESLFAHMRTTLTNSGFLPPDNPDHLMRTFRRLFGRAQLSDREVRILRGVLSSVDHLME
jgi:tRNA/rRNA methyltransferase